MKYRRVIVLHSFSGAGMQERIDAGARHFDAVEFAHVAVFDRNRGSPRLAEIDRLEDIRTDPRAVKPPDLEERQRELFREVFYEEVQSELTTLFDRLSPDLLVVHGGTIFRRYTGPMLQMLINLRERFPDVSFALEGRSEWLVETSGRNYHPFERQTVKNQIRWVKHNFTDDDDVAHLIEVLFE